jgi:tetratricopeptide (TPR) repeat protein
MPPREAKPKAKEAAQQALRLDPRLAEAHAVLGLVAMSYDWDLQNAENELKLAIDLNPNNTSAHEFYAHLLMVEGRSAEALTEIHHALDLDPVSPLFHTVLAQTMYYGRRYDEAIAEAQNVLSVNPTFVLAQYWLGCAYREKKMYPQAVQTFAHARQLSGDLPFMLMAYGHAQALAGNAKEARGAPQLTIRSECVSRRRPSGAGGKRRGLPLTRPRQGAQKLRPSQTPKRCGKAQVSA